MNAVWILENLLAPIVAGVVSAIVFSRFFAKREKDAIAKSGDAPLSGDDLPARVEDLPLTVRIKGEVPIGYYKLSNKVAKRMEPRFYAQLKQYGSQVLSVFAFAALIAIIALFEAIGGSSDAVEVLIYALIVCLALLPWKMMFGSDD